MLRLVLACGCCGLMVCCSSAAPHPNGSESKGAVVARFGDQVITAGEVVARLKEEAPPQRAHYADIAFKKELVIDMARWPLLAAEAARRGLDKDPDAIRAAQQVMVHKLVAQEIDGSSEAKAIPEDELRAYYQAHIGDYVRPELARLTLIEFAAPDGGSARARLPDAEKVLAEVRARVNDFSAFGERARSHSDDPASRAGEGDLGFMSREQVTARFGLEVSAAGFALVHAGDLSDVVETPHGLFLLRLAGRAPPLNQTFDQVKEKLQGLVWAQRRPKVYDQFVAGLREKAHFTIDEAELAKVQVPPR